MAYYNRKGEILKREQMEYLSSGNCAFVCHNNEIIFKEYFSDTVTSCRLTAKLFDLLKDIDDKHFIKLFEIYSDMDASKLMQKKFIVDAYTAKYYSDDSINALYEPVDYTLDNFSELEKLFDTFTNNSIVADDVKRKNAILSYSGIIIIDPDTFYTVSLPKQDIAIANKKELLTLFRSICVSGIKKRKNKEEILKKIILDLANIKVDNKTDVTHEICKKLSCVKKPMDYLIK